MRLYRTISPVYGCPAAAVRVARTLRIVELDMDVRPWYHVCEEIAIESTVDLSGLDARPSPCRAQRTRDTLRRLTLSGGLTGEILPPIVVADNCNLNHITT
jgi:hypothetical protein